MTPKNLDTLVNVNDSILNIYKFFNKIDNKEKSNSINPSCIYNVLNHTYKAMAGKDLKNNSNLKVMMRMLPEHAQRRSGVFIKKGYSFTDNYSQKFVKDHVLDTIPTDEASVDEINEKINAKFSDWSKKEEKFFSEPFTSDYQTHVRDQRYFRGHWEEPFKNMKMNDFYIGDNQKIKVSMMTRTLTSIFTYYDEEKKCDFISLPFKCGAKILIIVPRKPLNKKQLVDFCNEKISGRDIVEFYVRKGELKSNYYYNELSFPIFRIGSNWDLNDGSFDNLSEISLAADKYCSCLKTLFDTENVDLKNMINDFPMGKFKISIDMNMKTKINNGEIVKSDTKNLHDDSFNRNNSKRLEINRGFIFAIVSDAFVMSNVGLYIGKF